MSNTRLTLGVEIRKHFLRQGGTDEELKRVLAVRPDAAVRCAEMLRRISQESESVLSFTVAVHENETFDTLVEAGDYDSRSFHVTEANFPVRRSEPGDREVVILCFDRFVNYEEAIAEAKKLGLKLSTYEDALRFGAQYPEVQRLFPIVFMHRRHTRTVLCLSDDADGRRLGHAMADRSLGMYSRLAFIRPPTDEAAA